MIDSKVFKKMKDAASREFPKEACGFLLKCDDQIEVFQSRNDARYPKTEFLINPDEYLRALELGEIVAVWHSHTDGNIHPTEADLAGCEASGLTWFLFNVDKENHDFKFYNLINFSPKGYEAPYVGRPYIFGSFDCWTICRDFYKREFQIELPDYPRIQNFWESDKTSFFDNHFHEADLIDVSDRELVYGDIIYFQTDLTGNTNHAAIYVGDEKILHHREGCLSRHDRFIQGGYWKKHATKQLRHKSKC